jgi:putative membrane protein
MPRTSLALTATAVLLLTATAALAAPAPADKAFAMTAAQSGLAEVQAGQMASQKATSGSVKQFGQKLVTDHSQANDQLQQIAQQENLTLPTQPNSTQQAQGQRLSGLSGAAFDKAFVLDEVQDHQQAIATFQREAKSGKDPALKDFAQKSLPMLRQHLQMAQSLNNQH